MVSRGVRKVLALLVLLAGSPLGAQAPPSAPPTLLGSWSGSGKFTNEWGSPCQYMGATTPPSVSLELKQEGEEITGSLTLNIATAVGPGCPALQKHYDIEEAVVSGSNVSFQDPAGHTWDLALRGDLLEGIVAWKGGGSDEPLAESFVGPGGVSPHTRLSGEVSLARTEGHSGPKPKPSVGGTVRAVGGIVIANAVGLGALYFVNRATGNSQSSSSQANCSPRVCSVGSICVCNTALATGGKCRGTSGASLFAFCNSTDTPCQAGLSCNNTRCEDLTSGRCPP
jgi:hypothetical protein